MATASVEGIDWANEYFFLIYILSSEGMYSTDNFIWETASIQRVSAEIGMGTQTNSLETRKPEFWIFRLTNGPRLHFYGCIL